MVDVKPDLKKPPAIRDAPLMKRLHLRGVICAFCGQPGSLHHIYPRGQGGDDVEANLIGLCGSGTTGHHGFITAEDRETRGKLGAFIVTYRGDFIDYLFGKLGETEATEWLRRRLFVEL